MADLIQFDDMSGARIGRVVREVENPVRRARPLVFAPLLEASSGGGAKLRLGKTTAAWLRGTSAVIEIWDEGEAPDEEISSPLVTVTAWNKGYDVAACVWVLIAQATTGEWYLVEAATPDPSEGCAAPNIGGHDLTTIDGYASNKKQALTHDENACLKWVDIEDCA